MKLIASKTESFQDPYGGGGWAQVASEEEQRARKEDAMPDLGLPSKREKIQPVGFQIYIYIVHGIEIRGCIICKHGRGCYTCMTRRPPFSDLIENICTFC